MNSNVIKNSADIKPSGINRLKDGKIIPGADKMSNKEIELMLKKQTLIAWTELLRKNGTIDLAKSLRMIEMIEKLSA